VLADIDLGENRLSGSAGFPTILFTPVNQSGQATWAENAVVICFGFLVFGFVLLSCIALLSFPPSVNELDRHVLHLCRPFLSLELVRRLSLVL
jgi:hypothetical protein